MNLDWLKPEMRAALDAMTEPQRVATVLAGEARSEPIEGLVAVACVIRNRVLAQSWFGKTYSEVVTKRRQFSCLHPLDGERNYHAVLTIAQAFAAKDPITDPKVRQCVLIAHGIIDDYLVDNVQGATHYHALSLSPKKFTPGAPPDDLRPKWAQGRAPIVQRGGHVFYAGIK